jgi:hypothetical protein
VKTVKKSIFQKLEKNQLEKVIGGADTTSTSETQSINDSRKSVLSIIR